MSISTFFSDDHRTCDAIWAQVEGANPDQVAPLFASFDWALRRHFAWEEEQLFPAFEAATGMSGGPTQMMRMEHRQMRGMLDQMKEALEQSDTELMLDIGDTLLMMIQQHNSKEEQILYPMCEQALGEWRVAE